MKMFWMAAFAVIVPLGTGAAFAEPMTFDAALKRASEAPSLRGRDASVAAARSSAIAADRLPDPTLDVGLKDFPVTGPDAGQFNRDNFTMTTIGVSQQFTNPAKRRARAALAAAGIGVAEADRLIEARAVQLETALAWIDVYYGQKRLALLQTLDASLDDLQKTVSARLASGSARPSQALEPAQLRAQVIDRRATLVSEIARARAKLVRFTGDPDPQTAGDPPAPMVDGARLRASLGALPALRARDAATLSAEAQTGLARADKHPDWTVSASYGRREPAFGDLVSVGVSMDLPLFAKRRQDPKIAAAASEAARTRFDREAAEREWAAALDADLAEHAMHHQRLENARNTLVPLARQRATLDRDSYAAGKTDLGTALLATLSVAEADVDLLDREAEVARDAVRINITYAGDDR
ncbi:MAG: transporter [Sphingomonas sp. 28-62-20]|uniref:TolC family protein n=1 Tax=Sphingomonas sp. 28-62-20 TaxID=1970433 RepID=UPI000BD39A6A|nr:MAG: transporter [Sphingomonas sp. 28-62-20]